MNSTTLWIVAGGCGLVAILAGIGDHRRSRRRNLDRVGWVPWTLIQIAAIIAGTVVAAAAMKH